MSDHLTFLEPGDDGKENTALIFTFVNTLIFTVTATISLIVFIRLNHRHRETISKQYDELLKSNKELDYFLYSTSHDLRAPLTTVLGLINIAEDAKDDELNSYHGMMKSRIDRMDFFIRDIIDVVRNSRLPIRSESINLYKLVNEIKIELDNPMGLDTIYWNIDIPEDFYITSDAKRMNTILKNLISNAIKYKNPGREMCIIDVSALNLKDGVSIEIYDNGIGIGKDHLELIFDMFHRATEKSQGAGLGLYIVNETIKKLRGNIDVESKKGEFTKFTLKLGRESMITRKIEESIETYELV